MDRNTLLRWVVIAAAILLFWKFGLPLIQGKKDAGPQLPQELYANAPGFVPDALDPPVGEGPNKPQEGELCKIAGNRFDAELSTRGAAVTHFMLRDSQYAGTDGFDMSSTPDHERWRNLRTTFRTEGANDQLKYDRFDWKLERAADGKGCTFTYSDADVAITKVVRAGDRPFELSVDTTVQNASAAPKKHAFATETFAWRVQKDVKGSMGRQAPFMTELSCAAGKEITRKNRDDFGTGWVNQPGTDRYASLNTAYFTQALMPQGEAATCSLLAEDWLAPGQPKDDDNAPMVYHARLAYPARELAAGQSVTYKQIAFFGPKERVVLDQAGGGAPRLSDTVNLGFFSPVAKFLTGVLEFIHGKIGNWGVSIILMTLCLKLVLFPLTFKSIKSSVEMRKLRPEIDALNARFKDDMQAKNLAMMELWKKHGVSPFGGCLPQMIQMPVWFAMYTTLQTAVPMYHTHFLWFSDLSAPDRFYVLPLALGALMIVQQRIMPQQPGMDPMQQKMMTWMMPIIFTVMMLFLPAALGVYMMTNSLLNITQQMIIEKIAPRGATPAATAKGDSGSENGGKGGKGRDKKGDIVVKSG
jgi:YidC/Oxa1 family membrane protein insertase